MHSEISEGLHGPITARHDPKSGLMILEADCIFEHLLKPFSGVIEKVSYTNDKDYRFYVAKEKGKEFYSVIAKLEKARAQYLSELPQLPEGYELREELNGYAYCLKGSENYFFRSRIANFVGIRPHSQGRLVSVVKIEQIVKMLVQSEERRKQNLSHTFPEIEGVEIKVAEDGRIEMGGLLEGVMCRELLAVKQDLGVEGPNKIFDPNRYSPEVLGTLINELKDRFCRREKELDAWEIDQELCLPDIWNICDLKWVRRVYDYVIVKFTYGDYEEIKKLGFKQGRTSGIWFYRLQKGERILPILKQYDDIIRSNVIAVYEREELTPLQDFDYVEDLEIDGEAVISEKDESMDEFLNRLFNIEPECQQFEQEEQVEGKSGAEGVIGLLDEEEKLDEELIEDVKMVFVPSDEDHREILPSDSVIQNGGCHLSDYFRLSELEALSREWEEAFHSIGIKENGPVSHSISFWFSDGRRAEYYHESNLEFTYREKHSDRTKSLLVIFVAVPEGFWRFDREGDGVRLKNFQDREVGLDGRFLANLFDEDLRVIVHFCGPGTVAGLIGPVNSKNLCDPNTAGFCYVDEVPMGESIREFFDLDDILDENTQLVEKVDGKELSTLKNFSRFCGNLGHWISWFVRMPIAWVLWMMFEMTFVISSGILRVLDGLVPGFVPGRAPERATERESGLVEEKVQEDVSEAF